MRLSGVNLREVRVRKWRRGSLKRFEKKTDKQRKKKLRKEIKNELEMEEEEKRKQRERRIFQIIKVSDRQIW